MIFSDGHFFDHLSGLSREFVNLPHYFAKMSEKDPNTIGRISAVYREHVPRFGRFVFFNQGKIEWVNGPGIYNVHMTPTPAELQVLCLCVALSLPEERLPTLIAIDGVDRDSTRPRSLR